MHKRDVSDIPGTECRTARVGAIAEQCQRVWRVILFKGMAGKGKCDRLFLYAEPLWIPVGPDATALEPLGESPEKVNALVQWVTFFHGGFGVSGPGNQFYRCI